MPFSLSSYLLGVGTVMGALAFGFGGGIVLTKTALKASPGAATRVERVTRAESLPSSTSPQNPDKPQNLDNATASPAGPSPAPMPVDTVGSAATTSREGKKENISAKPEEFTSTETPQSTEPSKKSADPSGKSAELKAPERQKPIDHKASRQKREVERKAKEKAGATAGRVKPGRFEEVEPPNGTFAFRRQEVRPNFFEDGNETGETRSMFEQSNKPAGQSSEPAYSNEAGQRKMSDRKLARQQRGTERSDTARQPRQFEPGESPSRMFAFERQEVRPSLFDLFGPPHNPSWDQD